MKRGLIKSRHGPRDANEPKAASIKAGQSEAFRGTIKPTGMHLSAPPTNGAPHIFNFRSWSDGSQRWNLESLRDEFTSFRSLQVRQFLLIFGQLVLWPPLQIL